MNNPFGLAFDAAGNLYAANSGDSTIEKFTPGGTGSLFASVARPYGLAFDSAGNLYAANSAFSSIVKFTPSGTESIFADYTKVSVPQGLAFTNDVGTPLPLANQVPEPAAWALLASVLLPLLAWRHWRASSTGKATDQAPPGPF